MDDSRNKENVYNERLTNNDRSMMLLLFRAILSYVIISVKQLTSASVIETAEKYSRHIFNTNVIH
jgi:hypothetical protein